MNEILSRKCNLLRKNFSVSRRATFKDLCFVNSVLKLKFVCRLFFKTCVQSNISVSGSEFPRAINCTVHTTILLDMSAIHLNFMGQVGVKERRYLISWDFDNNYDDATRICVPYSTKIFVVLWLMFRNIVYCKE